MLEDWSRWKAFMSKLKESSKQISAMSRKYIKIGNIPHHAPKLPRLRAV